MRFYGQIGGRKVTGAQKAPEPAPATQHQPAAGVVIRDKRNNDHFVFEDVKEAARAFGYYRVETFEKVKSYEIL